jgi:hypothetical protein
MFFIIGYLTFGLFDDATTFGTRVRECSEHSKTFSSNLLIFNLVFFTIFSNIHFNWNFYFEIHQFYIVNESIQPRETRGHIFSCELPFYEWAVCDLNP